MKLEINKIYNEDCLIGMQRIPDGSIDCILTDPPYLYLKNQRLDRPFDETAFFNEVKRVLKKDGFIVMFWRGTSFYRWNMILAGLGFNFKEEFIWDKRYSTSPLMAISRVHESLSIYTKGKGTINRVKLPYLEMKKHDMNSIIADIKRLKACFNNTKSLNAVLNFLNNNYRDTSDGLNEKIIRTDRECSEIFMKYNIAGSKKSAGLGNRSVNVMQSIVFGLNERSIIKQGRDHYNTIHPTQKPVRLLERILALVTKDGDTVLDPFSGSGSTAVGCINANRNYIGFEIDKEYYDLSVERLGKEKSQQKLLFNQI